VELKQYSVRDSTKSKDGHKIFELFNPNGRNYVLHCDQEAEREAWMRAFQQNVEYLHMIRKKHLQEMENCQKRIKELEAEMEKQRIKIQKAELSFSERDVGLREKENELKRVPELEEENRALKREKNKLAQSKEKEIEDLQKTIATLQKK